MNNKHIKFCLISLPSLLIFISSYFLYIKLRLVGNWSDQSDRRIIFNFDGSYEWRFKEFSLDGTYKVLYFNFDDKYFAAPKEFRIISHTSEGIVEGFVTISDNKNIQIRWYQEGKCPSTEPSILSKK